jgi:hypothetical protein
MNIFFLSIIAKQAAQQLCDKHCIKMILETAQLLSCAFWQLLPEDHLLPVALCKYLYKETHVNHPMTKWVRQSPQNFKWALDHGIELCQEYSRRYSKPGKPVKVHKTLTTLLRIKLYWETHLNNTFKSNTFSVPPQCMPEIYRVDKNEGEVETFEDVVNAYWRYYAGDKEEMAKWKYSNVPDRWNEEISKKRKRETN